MVTQGHGLGQLQQGHVVVRLARHVLLRDDDLRHPPLLLWALHAVEVVLACRVPGPAAVVPLATRVKQKNIMGKDQFSMLEKKLKQFS